jgi:hypothetical protein
LHWNFVLIPTTFAVSVFAGMRKQHERPVLRRETAFVV